MMSDRLRHTEFSFWTCIRRRQVAGAFPALKTMSDSAETDQLAKSGRVLGALPDAVSGFALSA